MTVHNYVHGDFVRPGSGNVHIVNIVYPVTQFYVRLTTMCGKWLDSRNMRPASGDYGRQCDKCWDAM